jgi:GntR family transcriptional repressor for pyruvate dehydrogenase complex
METHGLGRVTVREAVRVLERDGLVDIKRGPTGGIFVRHADIRQVSEAMKLLFSFSDTTLGEFADFRMLVEPRVAAMAAENATEEQRVRLRQIGDLDLHRAGGSADLHSMLAEACGNGVFALVLQGLHVPLEQHIRRDQVTDAHITDTERAHAKIARAVVAGDCAGAEKAMIKHLTAYTAYLEHTGLKDAPIVPRVPMARMT